MRTPGGAETRWLLVRFRFPQWVVHWKPPEALGDYNRGAVSCRETRGLTLAVKLTCEQGS